MVKDLDLIDPHFVKRLQASDFYKCLVGLWMLHEGFNVTMFATEVRPDSKERFDYADEGDLEVWNKETPRTRVEVKGSTYKFTGKEDFPFPDSIVETAYKLDHLKYNGEPDPRPLWVFRLNMNISHCVFMTGASRCYWEKKSFYNNMINGESTCYYLPREHLMFRAVPDMVRTWASALLGGSPEDLNKLLGSFKEKNETVRE
jgi:hypothetical protein